MESGGLWRSVYATASYNLAVTIEESLNKAGYQTKICGDDMGMKNILVLTSRHNEAQQLLQIDTNYREFFSDMTSQNN